MCGLMSKVRGWGEMAIQDSCPGAFFGLVIEELIKEQIISPERGKCRD